MSRPLHFVRRFGRWLADAPPAGGRWVAFAPVLTVIAIFLAEGHFYVQFSLSSSQLSLPRLDWREAGTAIDLVARDFLSRQMLHLTTAALLCFFLITVGAAAAIIIASTAGRPVARWAALLVPLAGAHHVLGAASGGKNWVLVRLPRQLLDDFFYASRVENVGGLENLLSGLLIASLTFLAAAAWAILQDREDRPGAAAPRPEGDPIERLRQRGRRARVMLYCGAVVLVTGVFHVGLLFHWPADFLTGEEAEAVRRLADGYSTAIGLFWSLLLIALYLPTTLLLQAEAARLAEDRMAESTSQERRQWLAKEKLTPSPFEMLSRVAAVLGPFIAGGPLTAVLELLGG